MSVSTQETYAPTQQKGMTQTQIEKTLQTIADGFRVWPRSPILHWPEEEGLEYEDVSFPSQDGVPLEGWFIPASGSNKIIVANHPRWFNRSGLPSHLEPWKSLGGATGNDFEELRTRLQDPPRCRLQRVHVALPVSITPGSGLNSASHACGRSAAITPSVSLIAKAMAPPTNAMRSARCFGRRQC